MKFEDAILFLRQGQAIYRSSDPEKGYLCGTPDKIWGSFYHIHTKCRFIRHVPRICLFF